MNSLEMLLAKPVFQALGWALVHFIWQGAAVALLYAGLAALLRQRAANVRYSVACAAMLLMIALPIATVFILERSSTRTLDESVSRRTANAESPARVTALPDGRQSISNETPPSLAGAYASQSVPAAQNQSVLDSANESSASPVSWRLWAKQRFASLMPWLVALWFAGVLFLSLRFLGGLFIAQRLKHLETSPMLEQWQEKLAALGKQLRVSRPVRLCESVLVEVPTVIGWLRPVILVPASALTGLSPAQLEALLAHELGHIRRYDYLVNLLQTAVETLLFYHPAVWWLSSQIRQEREHCCDDLAVATCGNVLMYARALAELEQLRSVTPQLAVAANGGVLMRRIQRLIGSPARNSHRFESWLAGVIALATIFCLLAGAQTTMLSGDVKKATVEDLSAAASVAAQAARDTNNRREPGTDQKHQDALAQENTDESQSEQQADAPSTVETAETIALDQANQESAASGSGDFISDMAAAGYTHLSVDDLVALKTHGVTPEFIKEMNALFNQKLSVDTLTALRIHGVTPKFMADIKAAGYTNLSADDLVAFSIHGVTPQYISEWKSAGYDHLSADDLTAFRIHGVTAGFVQEMKAFGFNQLSPDDLTAFRIHGVTTAFVQTMRSYIHGNLSPDDLTGLRIHGVTPEFIKEMEAAGYASLSADDLTGFRIHGVSLSFIKSIQSLGYKPSADQLMSLRIHGVTVEFIETVKSRGFTDVTLDQLIELRRLNIIPGSRKK